jgi:hypothetical protein
MGCLVRYHPVKVIVTALSLNNINALELCISFLLLEDSQAVLARPFDKDRMRLNTLV